MSSIQIFDNPQFGEVRVVELNGKTYFVGTDVARSLGYARPSDAISTHCKNTAKHRTSDNQGVPHDYICVSESDIYRLVMRSKIPDAEKFQDWVCEEVLPSIRRNGGYLAAKENESPEEIMARALMIAQQTIDRSKQRVQELESENTNLKSRALFADAVASSGRSVLIGELAKILIQKGINIGQNRMFEWLRKNHYLCSKGEYYNQPTQKAMELGLFEIKKTSITKPDGTTLVTTTTKVTGKGQIYFVNKFLNAS